MKLYFDFLAIMWKKNFLILAMMVVWIGMVVWTFFWWNSKNDTENTPLQSIETWFIEELTNTWSIVELNENNESTGGIETWTSQDKISSEIRVMMPRYFYNSEWKRFAETLLQEKNVEIKFVFIDDLNSYRDQLSEPDFSVADLFLFPYDWLNKTPTRSFSFQQNIQSSFDQIIAPIVNNEQIAFLPFAADPMVMYAISWYSDNNSFFSISEFVLDRENISYIPLSFPLFFGINSEDYDDKKGFKWEYQDIMRYALMHYFTTNRDSKALWTWIDSNVLQNYNMKTLNTISNAITAKECEYFPAICFQSYNFVWLRFGFLSDADVVSKYFSWKKSNFSKLSRITVPFYQLESPVRVWWRSMPSSLDNPKKVKAVYAFLIQYMNRHSQYNLWNSTLSVFSWDVWAWLLNNDYIWLRWYVLPMWWDYMDTLRSINKFWDLIEYQIGPNDYLK